MSSSETGVSPQDVLVVLTEMNCLLLILDQCPLQGFRACFVEFRKLFAYNSCAVELSSTDG